MEWLLLALAAAGGAGIAGRRFTVRRARQRDEHEVLEAMRRLADEDVTVFGEQLQALDVQIAGREIDTATRADYQNALDAYESAQRAVPRLTDPEAVSTIIDTLTTGRYALACVQARVAGEQVPELRVPCFFNPQHGPSVTDVVWTRPRHGTRTVPACAQDAARVAAREQPELRTVRMGSRTVPYWEAGAAYLPYGHAYFPAGYFGGAAAAGGLGHVAAPSESPPLGDVGGDWMGEGFY